VGLLSAKDSLGRPPLQVAILWNQLGMVRFLLDKGAQIEDADSDGVTALMQACCDSENAEIVKKLLLHPGVITNLEAKNNDGCTALFLAAHYGNKEIVKRLVDAGADLKAVDSNGATGLIIAASNGQANIVEMLMELDDVDLEAKNNDGYAAFLVAAAHGHAGVVQ